MQTKIILKSLPYKPIYHIHKSVLPYAYADGAEDKCLLKAFIHTWIWAFSCMHSQMFKQTLPTIKSFPTNITRVW